MTTDPQSRLVPLTDGRPGLRSSIQVQISEPAAPGEGTGPTIKSGDEASAGPVGPVPSPGGPCLDFISSDETLDRYGEIITAAGWKLDTYLRNPVFQNSHQYGDILFTLGKAISTEVRQIPSPLIPLPSDGRGEGVRTVLYQRIEFATDINPMARLAYGLYKGKFLNAVSVGFVPIRWENGTEKTAYTRKYVEQELLEVSAVAIPANPNALALGLKSGAVEKADVRDLADLLRVTLDPARNPQPSTLNHQLLQRLAHEIRSVLNS